MNPTEQRCTYRDVWSLQKSGDAYVRVLTSFCKHQPLKSLTFISNYCKCCLMDEQVNLMRRKIMELESLRKELNDVEQTQKTIVCD